MTEKDSKQPEATYRIGAVSRLTGIPAETLRVWERRYGVVEPGRAEGRFRMYSRDDVGRLALIKQLVDAGNAIGSVANLSLEQLRERLKVHSTRGLDSSVDLERSCRVAILGDVLPARISAQQGELKGLEIAVSHQDRQHFERQVRDEQVDVIVLEYPTINRKTVTDVNDLLRLSGARHAVVIYGFGRSETVNRLDTSRMMPVRAPVSMAELERACLGATKLSTLLADGDFVVTGPIPPRRYDNESLGRIACASTTVECECPHHLADLIMSLSAFETYSAECESRSKEDAALHAHLHATTAQARFMIEQALEKLVKTEGLKF